MEKKPRSRARWTAYEDGRLYKLIVDGHYTHEIADKMKGRTSRSVSNRIYNKKHLRDAYKEASDNRSRRERQVTMSAALPSSSPLIETSKVDLGTVTKVATASAIFSIATFVLVLFVIA